MVAYLWPFSLLQSSPWLCFWQCRTTRRCWPNTCTQWRDLWPAGGCHVPVNGRRKGKKGRKSESRLEDLNFVHRIVSRNTSQTSVMENAFSADWGFVLYAFFFGHFFPLLPLQNYENEISNEVQIRNFKWYITQLHDLGKKNYYWRVKVAWYC